jgi:hypothetical protein
VPDCSVRKAEIRRRRAAGGRHLGRTRGFSEPGELFAV